MRRGVIIGFVLVIGIGSAVWSEWRKAEAPVSARALLNFIADAEREASRVPLRLTRLSDAEEIDIGNQLARRHTSSWPPSGDPDRDRHVENYVRTVGKRVSGSAKRALPYEIHYIPGRGFMNAFALPGGHVFVGQGLLSLMETEDQLAALLGHEIEHVDLYHCAERVQVESRARKIPLGELISLPVMIFQAGYTKNQELESDREGVWLAVRAGYSPYGAIRMFEKFEELRATYVIRAKNPSQELSQVTVEMLRDYFRSHPLPDERIQQIRDLIGKHKWEYRTKETPLEITVRKL